MATGGNYPFRSGATEPRPRSGWQRTTSASDKDDNVSLNSLPNELRPNNWDFSDWKPASIDNTKRRKKGNPEREREQSLTLDSPPPTERQQRTPSTYPRTRITPSTPTSQRLALEKLRQHLTFSDLDDGSNDGEKNNERNVPSRRGNLPNFTRQDMSRSLEETTRSRHGSQPRSHSMYSNNTREEASSADVPDSGQIVGRLMQIREYIKQTNTMMESLKKSGSPQANREEIAKLRNLIENLQDQERAYLGLLQNLLSFKGDLAAMNGPSNQEEASRPESREDTQSIDLDVQSETSEATLDNLDDKLLNCLTQGRVSAAGSRTRPRIEDKLGLSEEEEDESSPENMEDTVMEASLPHGTNATTNYEYDYELADNLNGEGDGEEDDELQALRQQEQLLRRLHEQQEQMRALKGRQAALMALQKDAEQKLAEARRRDNQALAAAVASSSSTSNNTVQRANILPSPQPDSDAQGTTETASDGMPRELHDMRQQLSYLRNELKEQNRDTSERQSNPELEAAASAYGALDENRQQLQDKLKELQEKKQKMDRLLQELNSLRNERYEVLTRMNNGAQPPEEELEQLARSERRQPSNRDRDLTEEGEEALSEADNTVAEAEELKNIIEAREKLRKLQEVKERLNQLRSLVQYYQTSAEQGVVPDVDERTAFQNMIEDYNQGLNPNRPVVQESGRLSPLGATGGGTVPRPPMVPQKKESDNRSDSDSSGESESNLSSLGPWGDDPEIQAKVRKLKAAKEKLKQLQNIVSMVQRSPDAAQSLPDNLAEIANSLEDAESQFTQPDDKNVSASEGEVPVSQAERDAFYESKMQEQMRELDQLKEERRRLLAIQQELQTLHDRFGKPTEDEVQAEEEEEEEEDEMPQLSSGPQQQTDPQIEADEAADNDETSIPVQNNGRPARPGVPVVKFSSNDEVYGKMRKQRMLREELRQKKRELEAIMKKDSSRKQYGKNQDNQSDTVSYTTADAFGATASVDATMATWGGSTVDNLESITEDEDGQPINAEMEEDDAYPSDGIVQVEEEEEENDSDNETYTIEEDVRQRRLDRSKKTRSAEKGGARPKQRQSYPRAKGQSKESSRSQQSSWRKPNRRQPRQEQNYDDETDGLRPQGNIARQGSELVQQQIQQQQLMLSLNQCLQQMALQQMEIQNMQRQMQYLSTQVFEPEVSLPSPYPTLPDTLRLRPATSQLPAEVDSRRFSSSVNSRSFSQPMFASRGANPDVVSRERRDEEYGTSRSRERRRETAEQSSKLASGSKKDIHKMGVKQKTNSIGKGDGIMKRKTSNMSDRNRRNNTKSRQERDSDNIPPLNLQEIRKKKMNSQNNWSTASLASSSKLESGMEGPDVARVTRGGPSSISQRLGVGDGVYRPGLSAGISGAGFQLENSSMASTMSNRDQQQGAVGGEREDKDRESDDPGDLTLFEALRESIYSEVATLISQNENRPHFLIEIFRELQLLTSDYLRQRVLYSIKDIVSKYLTEQNTAPKTATPIPAWINTNALNNCTTSELTPSESAITTDDEEINLKMKVREIQNSAQRRRGLPRGQSLQNEQFDYEENADNDSSLSTPSNSYWENPFAQDSLGDTAIHLDKALERMKEYDRKVAREEAENESSYQRELRYQRENYGGDRTQDPNSSSAVDQGSESDTVSSVSYPKIDTQQLDQQIKTIMSEVIPVVKENMEQVCSSQLLAYIKRLALSLTQQYDSSQYSRFFHNQLSTALQDTLVKFEGRKMRQCGEDLLVDISEVLFNELAFFRLMEGLGEPPTVNNPEPYCSTATQTQDEDEMSEGMGDKYEQTEESDTTESSSTMGSEAVNNSVKANATEEEDLGKVRDDELANDTNVQDAEEKDDDDTESPYKTSPVQIELAPSETKPFTRIGSDEDDEDADESQSADDPSETAVSRDAMMERSLDMDNDMNLSMPEEELSCDQDSNDADQGAQSGAETGNDTPRAEEVPQMNGEVVENGEVTIDDLPPTLNVVAENIQNKMSEEQQSNSSPSAMVEMIPNHEELAGDGQFLKEPGA